METESGLMIRELESQLHHTVFKDISRPTILKLNSPVLQRKEGYREVLRVWLMFDLAAKLIWKGGDDIYSGGKKILQPYMSTGFSSNCSTCFNPYLK